MNILGQKIWMCKVHLKMLNPKQSSREKFLTDECELLIILDDFDDIVHIPTNHKTMNRTIKRLTNDKFTYEHIVKIIPLKYLGQSLAKE